MCRSVAPKSELPLVAAEDLSDSFCNLPLLVVDGSGIVLLNILRCTPTERQMTIKAIVVPPFGKMRCCFILADVVFVVV